MTTDKSLFKCCLSINEDNCSDQKFTVDDESEKYVYNNCNELFDTNKINLLTSKNAYGLDDYFVKYQDNGKYKKILPLYALHSTNDQMTNDFSPRKNMTKTKTDSDSDTDLYNIYTNNLKISDFIRDKQFITNLNDVCDKKPFRHYIKQGEKLSASLCYINPPNSDPSLLFKEINYDKKDVENGSDLCNFKIDDRGELQSDIEDDENACEKKYIEWNINKFDELGVNPSTNISIYPSFTKYAKCKYDKDNKVCTMKKQHNSSLVNECLEHTGCDKDKLFSGDCNIEDYSLDYLSEKGYNREYTNLCGCKYDYHLYEEIQKTSTEAICRQYGLTDENSVSTCMEALKNNLIDRTTHSACKSFVPPCSFESTVVKEDSDNCREIKDDASNYIQICSNEITAKGVKNINANLNTSCTQIIQQTNTDVYNKIKEVQKEKNKSPPPAPGPPPPPPAPPPAPSTDYMTYFYYILGALFVLLMLFGIGKMLTRKNVPKEISTENTT